MMSQEVGTLPLGWVEITLDEVTHIRNEKIDPVTSAKKAYLSLEHIESGTNRIIDRGVSDDVRSTKSVFFSGDVLYGKLRPYLNKVCQPDFDGICSTDILVFGPSPALDNALLLRFLSRSETVEYANGHSKGINLPRISPKQLGELKIQIPPLNEQKRIVAKIEKLQRSSRRARESLEVIPDLLDHLRQSVLAAAFSGELTKEWRANHHGVEPASELLKRIRMERRKRWEEAELEKLKAKGHAEDKLESEFAKRREQYKEPLPVDTTHLPELPEGWCWASLAELALIKGGLTKGKKRNRNEKLFQVPYLRVANVQRGHLRLDEVLLIEATEAEVNELLLVAGDILLNEGGDLDKLGRGWVWHCEVDKCIHQNHVFRARLVDKSALIPEVVSTYINEFGQSFFLREGKQTTNLASVSLTNLSKTSVPVIPTDEAKQLWQEIEQCSAVLNSSKIALTLAEDYLASLDQSILSKTFRGQLMPQDPDDEPASVLLNRIRELKAKEADEQRVKGKEASARIKQRAERD